MCFFFFFFSKLKCSLKKKRCTQIALEDQVLAERIAARYAVNSRIKRRSAVQPCMSIRTLDAFALNSTIRPDLLLFYVRFPGPGFIPFPDLWNLILRKVCARNRHNRVCFALSISRASNAGRRNAVRLFGGSRRIRPAKFPATIETSEWPITPLEKLVMNSSCRTWRRKTTRRQTRKRLSAKRPNDDSVRQI